MFVKCRNKCGTNMVEISKAMKIKSIRFKKRSIRLIWFMAFIRFIRQTQNSDFDIEVLAFQIATLIINWINLNSMLQLWGLQIVSFAKNFGISTPPTSFHAEIKDASLFFLSLNCRKLLSSGQSGTEGGLVSFPLPISHHHLFPDIKLKGKPVKIGRTTWSGGNPSRHPFDHADIEKSSEILTATYRVALSFWPRCHGNSSKSYKLVPCLLDWPAHFSAFPPTGWLPPPFRETHLSNLKSLALAALRSIVGQKLSFGPSACFLTRFSTIIGLLLLLLRLLVGAAASGTWAIFDFPL